MAVYSKSIARKYLEKLNAKYIDNYLNNEYFGITGLRDELTIGKQGFYIRGSDFIKAGEEILFEVIGSDGKALETKVAQGLTKDASRLISIGVYENTPNGKASLYLYTVCDKDKNGNQVPDYGVRFEHTLIVNKEEIQTSPITFDRAPLVSISEKEIPSYRLDAEGNVFDEDKDGQYKKTLLEVRLQRLNTFTGDVKRLKVFKQSVSEEEEDFSLLFEKELQNRSILRTEQDEYDYGILPDETFLDYFDLSNISAPYNVEWEFDYTNNAGGMKLSGSLDIPNQTQKITTSPFSIYPDNIYEFHANVACLNKNVQDDVSLEVYITGSNLSVGEVNQDKTTSYDINDPIPVGTVNEYGVLISEFKANKGTKNRRFSNTGASFINGSVGDISDARLVFVWKGGEYTISDIQFGFLSNVGFNQSNTSFKIPLETLETNKFYKFKVEYFDFNSNKAKHESIIPPVYITGSVLVGINHLSSSVNNNISNLSQSVTLTTDGLDSRIFTNIDGQLNKTPSPTGDGLYTGDTHLGFWNGSKWITYMDNQGDFYLSGSNGFLTWESATESLTIQGNIFVTGGDVATTSSVNNLSSSIGNDINNLSGSFNSAIFGLSGSAASASLAIYNEAMQAQNDAQNSFLSASNTFDNIADDNIADETEIPYYRDLYNQIVQDSGSIKISATNISATGSVYDNYFLSFVNYSASLNAILNAPTYPVENINVSPINFGLFFSAYYYAKNDILAEISNLAQSNAQSYALNITPVDPTTGILKNNPSPTGQGLFLNSSHLGYFNNDSWQTFMSSSGELYLTSSIADGGYLYWDPLTGLLNIRGAINITGGNAATQDYTDTIGANAEQSASLYADNAAQSASNAAEYATQISSSISSDINQYSASVATTTSNLDDRIFTDSDGRLNKPPTTNNNGLYLGADYLGFYSGSSWKTYMDSQGDFYLTGSLTDSGFLAWDSLTQSLTIKGNIFLTGGDVASTSSVDNLSSSVGDSLDTLSGSVGASIDNLSGSFNSALFSVSGSAASASLAVYNEAIQAQVDAQNSFLSASNIFANIADDNIATEQETPGYELLYTEISNDSSSICPIAVGMDVTGSHLTEFVTSYHNLSSSLNLILTANEYPLNGINDADIFLKDRFGAYYNKKGILMSFISEKAKNDAQSYALNVTPVDPLTGILKNNPTPTGQGLFLNSTHLGYYSNSKWQTYMSASGEFFLTSSVENGNYLFWNPATGQLEIKGSINITGGNAATQTNVNDSVLSGSTYANNAVLSASNYANNAAISASNALTRANEVSNVVNEVFSNIANDNIASAEEIPYFRDLYAQIVQDSASIEANSILIGATGSAYTNYGQAFTNYSASLDSILSSNGYPVTEINNPPINFRSTFESYYLEKTNQLTAISNKAQENAENFASEISSSISTDIVSQSSSFATTAGNLDNRIFTNADGKINKTPSTTESGLFLGSSNLGYYDGTNWVTYMDNEGDFYLTGSSGGGFLAWDSATESLTIQGNIYVTGGDVATTSSVNNLSSSIDSSLTSVSSSLNNSIYSLSGSAASASLSVYNETMKAQEAAQGAFQSASITFNNIANDGIADETEVPYYKDLYNQIVQDSGSIKVNATDIGATGSVYTSYFAAFVNYSASLSEIINAIGYPHTISASLQTNFDEYYYSKNDILSEISKLAQTNAQSYALGITPTDPVTGILKNNPTPDGSGLFLNSTHLGYYNSNSWQTYMASTGEFYLTSSVSDGSYLFWDPSAGILNIKGAINITGGNASTQDYVNTASSNAVLSGSSYADNAVLSGSQYASNAVLSASNYANNAAESASLALVSANNSFLSASSTFDNIANDNIADETEIPYYRDLYNQIIQDSGSIKISSTNIGATGSAFNNYYAAFNEYSGSLNDILNAPSYPVMGINDASINFRTNFDEYYYAKNDQLTAISNKAQENAEYYTSQVSSSLSGSIGNLSGSIDNLSGSTAQVANELSSSLHATSGSINNTILSVSSSVAADIITNSSSFASTSELLDNKIFTDSTGKINKAPNTTSDGLFLGSTHLGFYSGSTWRTYMDNQGDFYLTGSDGGYLVWSASDQLLGIKGDIIADTIITNSGSIAGWEITSESIIKTLNNNTIELSSESNALKLLDNSVERIFVGLSNTPLNPSQGTNIADLESSGWTVTNTWDTFETGSNYISLSTNNGGVNGDIFALQMSKNIGNISGETSVIFKGLSSVYFDGNASSYITLELYKNASTTPAQIPSLSKTVQLDTESSLQKTGQNIVVESYTEDGYSDVEVRVTISSRLWDNITITEISVSDLELYISTPKTEITQNSLVLFGNTKNYLQWTKQNGVIIKGGNIDSNEVTAGNLVVTGRTSLLGGITISGSVDSHPIIVPAENQNTNNDGWVLRSLTFDEFGHTTNASSYNLDNRYYTESESDNKFFPLSGGTITGNTTFNENITVNGNLSVMGGYFSASVQQVIVSDNILTLNSGEQGSGVTSGFSGIEVDRGTSDSFWFVFDEAKDRFAVGLSGSTQVVATREDTPINKGIPFFNSTNSRLETSDKLIYDSGNLGVGIYPVLGGGGIHIHNDSYPQIRLTTSTSGTAHNNGSYIMANLDNLRIVNYEAKDIQFFTTGIERATIKADGKVGIKTSSPSYDLHVVGRVFVNEFIVGNEGKINSASSHGLTLQSFSASTPILFKTNVGGQTERMRINGDGNVGIGTSLPITKLDVAGDVKFLANVGGTGSTLDVTNTGIGRALSLTSVNTTNLVFNVTGPVSTDTITGRAFGITATGKPWSAAMFYTDGKLGLGGGDANRDVFLSRHSTGQMKISSDGGDTGGSLIVTDNLDVYGTTTIGTSLLISTSATDQFSTGTLDGNHKLTMGAGNGFGSSARIRYVANGSIRSEVTFGNDVVFRNYGSGNTLFYDDVIIEEDLVIKNKLLVGNTSMTSNPDFGVDGFADIHGIQIGHAGDLLNSSTVIERNNHADFVFGLNAKLGDTRDTLKNSITHQYIAGSGILLAGNAHPSNPGSILFFTSPTGAVTAGDTVDSLRMIIKDDGNIGFGTDSPTSKLSLMGQDVTFYSNTSNQSFKSGRDSNQYFHAYTDDQGTTLESIQDETNETTHRFTLRRNHINTGINDFQIVRGEGIIELKINKFGNVGINNTDPTHRLDVSGTSRFSGALRADGGLLIPRQQKIIFNETADTGMRGEIYLSNDTPLNNLMFDTLGVNRLILSDSGHTLTGDTDLIGKLEIQTTDASNAIKTIDSGSPIYKKFEVNYPALYTTEIGFGHLGKISYDGNGGRMTIANTSNAGWIKFVIGTNTAMHIPPSGFVGMGTTSPEAPLHVDYAATGWSAKFNRGITDGSTSGWAHYYAQGNAHILGRALILESAINISSPTPSATDPLYGFYNNTGYMRVRRTVGGATTNSNLLVFGEDVIGINKSAASRTLDIEGSFRSQTSGLGIDISANGSTTITTTGGNTGLTITDPNYAIINLGNFRLVQNVTSDLFHLRDEADHNVFSIDGPNNRVGINDTTPSYTLDVSGTFRATGAGYFNTSLLVDNVLIDGNKILANNTGGNLELSANTGTGYIIANNTIWNTLGASDNNFNLVLTNDSLYANVAIRNTNSQGTSGFYFYNEDQTVSSSFGMNNSGHLADPLALFFWHYNAHPIRFGTNSIERLRIGGDGGVTITSNTLITGSLVVSGSDSNAFYGDIKIDNSTISFTNNTGNNSLDLLNSNIDNVGLIGFNDTGAGEGIKWDDSAAEWMIDVSSEDRDNTDGNLNFYGTTSNIVSWRPHILKDNLIVSGSSRLMDDVVHDNAISTPTFASGFAGFGSKLYQDENDKWSMDLDNLTVRGRMRIYELLINRIRATNGSVWVSSTGKIETVWSGSVSSSLDQVVNVDTDYPYTGLVAHYNFNSIFAIGDEIKDFSGNGNHAVKTGNLLPITGSNGVGQYMPFSGSETVIAGDLGSLPDSGSISFWFSYDGDIDPANPPNILSTNATSIFNTIRFELSDAMHPRGMRVFTADDTSTLNTNNLSISLNNDTWYMITFLWNKTVGSTELYLGSTRVSNRTSGAVLPDTIPNFAIGVGYSNSRKFKGKIEEVRLYNKPLTPKQIELLYENRGGIKLKADETEHGFLEGDLIRAQRFNGSGVYQSDATVTWVENDLRTFYVEPRSVDLPQKDFEYVRIGNSFDKTRQGAVYLTSDDSGAPFIDIIDGIDNFNRFNTEGTQKARLGKLKGITDANLGLVDDDVYGLYTEAGYFRGNIIVGGNVNSTSLSNNTIALGNITGSSNNSLKISLVDNLEDSGFFAYNDSGVPIVQLQLSGSSQIAGYYINENTLWSGNQNINNDSTKFVLSSNDQSIKLGSSANTLSLTSDNTILLSGSGEFSFRSDENNYISKIGNELTIVSTNTTLSGSNVTINTENIDINSSTFKVTTDNSGLILLNGTTYGNSTIALSGSGEGKLADGNIRWTPDGDVSILGSISVGLDNHPGLNDPSFYVGNLSTNRMARSEYPSFGGLSLKPGSTASTVETSLPDLVSTGKVSQFSSGPSGSAASPSLSFIRFVASINGTYSGMDVLWQFWIRTVSGESFSLLGDINDHTNFIEYPLGNYVDGNWRKIVIMRKNVTKYISAYNFLDIGIPIDTTVQITRMQNQVGNTTILPYQKTDTVLSDELKHYGLWASSGGFGGTSQNPKISLQDEGIVVRKESGANTWLGDDTISIGFEDTTWGIIGKAGSDNVFELGSTNKIANWTFNTTTLSNNNITLNSDGIITLGSSPSMATNGIFLSGSGDFNIQTNANNYIRKTATELNIRSTKVYMSSSNVYINTPEFYLGNANNYLSGSGGNISIKSDTFNLSSSGIHLSDTLFNLKDTFTWNGSNLFISGSNVDILTPNFYLGGTDNYISGSNGNIEIKLTNNFELSSSNVHLADDTFNLSDKLTFDGTDLSIVGDISANSGYFSGSIYATSGYFNGEIVAVTGNIGGWDINSDNISKNNVTLDSNGIIKLGSNASMSDNGIFLSGSGDFNIQGDTNEYIRKSGSTLEIKSTNVTLSSSNVSINTPNFYLGGTNNYISGSGGNIEIKTTNEFELSSSNVHISSSLLNLGNKFVWNGSNLTVSGSIYATSGYFSGQLVSSTGNIGGWNITSSAITNTISGVEVSLGYPQSWTSGVLGLQVGTAQNNRLFFGYVGGKYTFAMQDATGMPFRLGTFYETNQIAGWDFTTVILSKNNITLDSRGVIKLGSSSSMTGDGIYLSGSGDFNIQSSENEYIRKNGNVLEIKSTNVALSSSNVSINTPNFYLGGVNNYISGSNGSIKIKSTSDFELSSSNVHLSDSMLNLGNKFVWNGTSLSLSGSIYATSGYFDGEIQSTTGNIGGWAIGDTFISSSNTKITTGTNSSGLTVTDSNGIDRLQIGDYPNFTEPTDEFSGVNYTWNVSNASYMNYTVPNITTSANSNNGTINLSSSISATVNQHESITGEFECDINSIASNLAADWELSITLILTENGIEIPSTSTSVNVSSVDWFGGTKRLSFLYIKETAGSSNNFDILVKFSLNKSGVSNSTTTTLLFLPKLSAFVHESKISITNDQAYLYTNPKNYIKWSKSELDIKTEQFSTNNLSVRGAALFEDSLVVSGSMVIKGQLTVSGSLASHPTINGASSVNNSGGNVIQDLTFDTFGHVTGFETASLDNRYVNLSGDTMTGNLTVQGNIRAQSKNFFIPNQSREGEWLTYASVETNRNDVYISGKIEYNAFKKEYVVTLPEEWDWLVDSKSIRVSLSSVGEYLPCYVKEINGNESIIVSIANKSNNSIFTNIVNWIKLKLFRNKKENNNDIVSISSNTEIHYTIYATRKDIPELKVYSKE